MSRRTLKRLIQGLLSVAAVLAAVVTGTAVWQQYSTPPSGVGDAELAALKIACDAQLKGGGAPGSAATASGAQLPAPPGAASSEGRVFAKEKTDILADTAADDQAAQAEANGDDLAYAKHSADQHWMADYAGSVRKRAAAQDDCARYFRKVRERAGSGARPGSAGSGSAPKAG